MASKDYYEILGVSKTATDDELKKAYRKMAREHHPDVATNKEEAEKKFKEINEAYQVLSDKNKRAQYDQFGSVGNDFGGNQSGYSQGNPFGGYTYTWNSSQGGQQNPFGDVDPFDIFEQVFGFRGYGGQRAPRRGKNLYYALKISFLDSIKGTTKKIRVLNEEFEVKIPAGINTGTELKVAGKGEEATQKNLPRGDLFLTLEVEENKEFIRQGADVYTFLDIPVSLALLGGEEKIKIIDPSSSSGFNELKLKIPQGTQSGTTFRIGGKGFNRLRNSGRGDHFVKVKVNIPSKLNRNQKELIEKLQKEGL
ncbi:DnaJ domain-containing protein [Patescibacteria group bacterium]|nr:DnaJ domain-containing protein [Patescibacteria group bacterium]